MWLDLLALAILGVFLLVGALRGALASGLGLASLVLSYAAAVFGATRYGDAVAAALGLSPLFGAPLAGSIAFVGCFALCAAVGSLLRRIERARRGELPRGGLDRLVGGLFGALRGALVVLLVGWLGIWLDAARQLGPADQAGLPTVEGSRTAALTGTLVEGAVQSALADSGPGGRFAARVAARPASALRSMQALLEDERIVAVQEDPLFWSLVENGASERALNQGSFYRIAHDEALRRDFESLGLIDAEAAADPAVFRQAAAAMLDEVGPRLKGLRDDPEIHRLARDPEVIALLESGDTIGLLRHPGIRGLVARVSAAP